jgi:hypothetical protein
MTNFKSIALLALVATFTLTAAAQSCSLMPGSVGLGNYCGDARSSPKVASATQAGPTPANSSTRTKDPSATNTQAVMPSQSQRWTILPTDGKLAVTFERWASAAGMKLIWDAQQHVMLSSADTFDGTLEQALSRVLSSSAIRQSAYPLEACVYPNNPPVLRITRLGDQKECQQ